MLRSILTGCRGQAATQAEIIALRHQLIVVQRTQKTKRLTLRGVDRCLWVWLSRLWSGWRSALIIVKPETVIDWHRQGFQWYWNWKIRHGQKGRPLVSKETRDLIRTLSRDKPTLGSASNSRRTPQAWHSVSQASVAKTLGNALIVPIKTTHEITGPVQCRQLINDACSQFGTVSCTVRWNIVEECLCLQRGYIESGNRIFKHYELGNLDVFCK